MGVMKQPISWLTTKQKIRCAMLDEIWVKFLATGEGQGREGLKSVFKIEVFNALQTQLGPSKYTSPMIRENR